MNKSNLTSQQLADLTFRYLNDTLSREEQEALVAWVHLSADNTNWFNSHTSSGELRLGLHDFLVTDSGEGEQRMHQLLLEVQTRIASQKNTAQKNSAARVYFLRKWGWVAASVILLATGAYLWNFNSTPEHQLVKVGKHFQADVPPGGNKARLTLADGTSIVLDDANNGAIAQQGDAQVVKLANGKISYNSKGVTQGKVMLNTMSTPNGGQYQLVLPDGTIVWLNAASTITYPAFFAGPKRSVKVTGEAYFEVAKNKNKPFIVDIDGKSSVEVLGTGFNINCYRNEENIKTTLVNGSIRITSYAQSATLKPGQQATIASPFHSTSDFNGISVNSSIDLAQTLAWKDGIFNFNGADLRTVMRQLERWYDIRIQYKGPISSEVFEGKMYRNVNLSDVLEMLKKMDVKFKLEGKNLIVL